MPPPILRFLFLTAGSANIDGVDLNLQFPADWELAKEIKFSQGYRSPAPRDYVGVAPLTAPESRAIYEFTMAHDFSLILAYHTQGEVIYWKYKDLEPPHSRQIADYFGQVSGYTVEETPMLPVMRGIRTGSFCSMTGRDIRSRRDMVKIRYR